MKKLNRYWLPLMALMSMTACGFHLQSRAELPAAMKFTRLAIQSPQSEFARRVGILLEQKGIQLVSANENAAVLEIPLNRARKEIQSIGDNARVREFQLRHTIRFRLLDEHGKVLIPTQTFEQTRTYSFDEQDILSAEREDEFLRHDLADSLARMLVRQLANYQK